MFYSIQNEPSVCEKKTKNSETNIKTFWTLKNSTEIDQIYTALKKGRIPTEILRFCHLTFSTSKIWFSFIGNNGLVQGSQT